jgi:predicted ribosomally synthesized peptide with nif11-like leader
MAKESVAQLFRAAQEDISLRETLSTAPNLEAFVQMAAEHGYQFTVDEWKEMMRFSVEELECEMSEIPGI